MGITSVGSLSNFLSFFTFLFFHYFHYTFGASFSRFFTFRHRFCTTFFRYFFLLHLCIFRPFLLSRFHELFSYCRLVYFSVIYELLFPYCQLYRYYLCDDVQCISGLVTVRYKQVILMIILLCTFISISSLC